ncbi:MAG: hypothetical protein OIF48_19955 [Silicimonas sp.]|nr:hypothetical protein [Silicimonas sp.]
MSNATSAAERAYSPLYFLASLGSGGLAVTFFMYLMFWVPHPNQPVPVFEDLMAALQTGGVLMQATIILAWAGIAWFGFRNLALLVWNLRRIGTFRASEAGQSHAASNAGSQVLAMPLALAMSVNVMFVLGMVFVPGLWSVVEYLFPLALIAFLAIGYLAFKQLGDFLGTRFQGGGFNCQANNSFAQLLPAFTFSMVGVGLAAPSAMSGNEITSGLSIILSGFFLVASITMVAIGVVMGVRSMLENGVAVEAAPTLLILLPVATVASILLLRQGHGLHEHFGSHATAGDTMVFLSRMISLEILFAMFGLLALARTGYWTRFVFGSETSPGSYALVCPGIAFSVLTHFWINKGLVAAGLIAKFGMAYWALTAVALASQLLMILLVLRLNRQHFGQEDTAAVPAE